MLGALIVSLIVGVIAALVFLVSLKKGMFDDVEDIKYEMFRDDKDR
jgi:cbb3-type cytochrome oxidase maturation protein